MPHEADGARERYSGSGRSPAGRDWRRSGLRDAARDVRRPCGRRVREGQAGRVLRRIGNPVQSVRYAGGRCQGYRQIARHRAAAAAVVPGKGSSRRMSHKTEQELLELERKHCSWGDTVHYLDPPKVFERSEGCYLYDRNGTAYLDLQMWYSAASFGYGNRRLHAALMRQLNTLPQLACQYLHADKIELAAAIGRLNASRFGIDGRVPFNVGGSQAIEDSLKLVRNG